MATVNSCREELEERIAELKEQLGDSEAERDDALDRLDEIGTLAEGEVEEEEEEGEEEEEEREEEED
jgi:hypothetical protein